MADLILSYPSLSMSSREIAELVNSRHDKVKQSIERLAERGVIGLPPLGKVKNHLGQTVCEYVFTGEQGQRDSIVVVAQLSPEFTGRLVDRWHELETGAAQPQFAIPKTYAAALIEAGKQAERADAAEAALAIECAKVEVMQPKAEALDEFYKSDGEFLIGEAAKNFGVKDKELRAKLIELKWLVRTTQASAFALDRQYMRQRFDEKNGRSFSVAVLTPSGLTILRHMHRTGELFTAYVPRHLLLPPSKD